VVGTPFGRYRLIELLGRGGMGEVWRAYDTATNNRTVAIKLLPAQLAADPMFVARFRREADAAARLNNPHIIPIHTYGEIDGRLYVDMRLIEGRDLHEILAEGPLAPGRAVPIIAQVAKALHAAHKIGLVHRDVKPSNILVDEDDFAYLIDFGIARGADQTGFTATGNIIGSWPYMSPERLRAGPVDARSDIYALACVLYQCLTGRTPYPGDNFEQQITAHLMEPPPRPSDTDPNIPAQVDEVIATGMAKDPDQRYATTVELAVAARDAITVPIARPTPTAPQPATAPTSVPTAAPAIAVEDHTPSTRPPTESTVAAVDAPSARQPVTPAPFGDPSLAATEHADRTNPPPTQQAPTGPPPAPPTRTGARGLGRRTKIALVGGAIALVAVIAAAVGIPALVKHQPSARSYGAQVVLPFTGLSSAGGVAVDAAGTLYVADGKNDRVLKLPSGATTPQVLPFTGLNYPHGVAVDAAGTLYVADGINNRVLKLPAGATTQQVLPFTGLNYPRGVAVDAAGTLYVVEGGSFGRVLKLPAGATTQQELPFTGYNRHDVAVDAAGTLYVVDEYSGGRVLKLRAGATTQEELPFTGLGSAGGVAVDAAGTLYVVEGLWNGRVLKLPAGATSQQQLPFTGLSYPHGVAVDAAGSLYVVAGGSDGRVLKLPVQ
jgi:serine/threonine protein kinase, bacterial